MARSIEVTGVVEAISKKTVEARGKNTPVYSFKLDGDWYRTNFKKPNFEEGDDITFTYTDGKYGKDVDCESVVVNEERAGGNEEEEEDNKPAKPTKTKAKPAATKSENRSGSKDGYWEAKEKRDIETQQVIQYQAARNTAVQLVSVLLTSGSLPVGKTKAAKANTVEAVEEALQLYTEKFFFDAQFGNISKLKPAKAKKPVVKEAEDTEAEESEEEEEETNGDD